MRGGGARRAQAAGVLSVALAFALLAACSLTTDFDGLVTLGADSGGGLVEAGDAGDAADAVEAGPPVDGGSDAPVDAGSAYAAAVLADAPLSWYRLDDLTPGTARDAMGRFHGVYQPYPSPSFQMEQGGAIKNDPRKSVRFLGGSIEVPDAFAFANGAPFTLELWIDLSPASATEFARVLSMENTPNGYNLSVNDTNLFFEMRGGGQPSISRFTPLPVGWAHCVVTYDGQVVRLYLDAVKVFEYASAARFPVRAGPFAIGGASYGGPDDHVKGRIDEVAVYDKALSVDRISAHFAAGK